MPPSLAVAVAIGALLVSTLTIGGVLVGAGMFIQRLKTIEEARGLKDLEGRHRELAVELRTANRDHEERLRDVERHKERSEARVDRAKA